MRILIIEDERRVASFMRRSLAEAGYAVDCAHDGQEGSEMAYLTDYDAIIVDLMLPKCDGLTVVRELRQRGKMMPVLAVTAKGTVHDRVMGLNTGCDDYLVKPFAVAEFIARVRSLLRRGAPQAAKFQVSDLVLDPGMRQVSRAGKPVELTLKEFALLEYLMHNAGHVVTKTMIEQHVWNYNFDSGTNLVEVHMSHLRNKVDRGFGPTLIQTVRGVGYVLQEASANAE